MANCNNKFRSIPVLTTLLACLLYASTAAAQRTAEPGKVRLYIFDNGQINGLPPETFNFTREEVKETDFVVTSELIVHPNGVLLWEAGAVPDHELPSDGSTFSDGPTIVSKSLSGQLAEIGYSMDDIDFFAMSHLHSDHNGNANDYANASGSCRKPIVT